MSKYVLTLVSGRPKQYNLAKSDIITGGDLIINTDIAAGAAIDYSKLNIADGDLTIAKTSGLSTALSGKLALAGGTMSGNIDMNNVAYITNLPTPTLGGHAASKSYVDQKAITGGVVKEALLANEQMSDAQGILAAEVSYFVNAPIDTDTFIIKNGTNTYTYTFKDTPAGAYDVQTSLSAVTSMQNLVTAITTNSTSDDYKALFTADGLDSMNVDGVIVIYEKATASGLSTSRIYGTWATQADCKVVEYAGQTQYSTEKAATSLVTTDPAAGTFGIRKQVSALTNGEIHVALATDVLREWNGDATVWYTLSGSGSLPDATAASGGGVKGKITADSDKGLAISSGIAEVKIDNSTIAFMSGGNIGKLYVPNGGINEAQLNAAVDAQTFASTYTAVNYTPTAVGSETATNDGTSKISTHLKGIDLALANVGAGWQNLTNKSGGAITIGQAVMIDVSAGGLILSKADAVATGWVDGLVKDASIADNAPGKVYVAPGEKVGGYTGLTPNTMYYLSPGTAGAITATRPTTAGQTIFEIGKSISTTEIIFEPRLVADL